MRRARNVSYYYCRTPLAAGGYRGLGQLCTAPKEPATNFWFDAGLLFSQAEKVKYAGLMTAIPR
jgi:hypothetical protein